MDKYTPEMLDKGLKGMGMEKEAFSGGYMRPRENGAVYFAAVGGAGHYFLNVLKSRCSALR